MAMKFFAMEINGNITFYDTEEEARNVAVSAFQHEEDHAEDGWHEDVEWICWGEVRQAVMLVDSKPDLDGKFDTIDTYEFRDMK